MLDTFTITIICIVICAFFIFFIRRKIKDKCLKDFSRDMVTLEETTGKVIWGKLSVENTGLELVYLTRHSDKSGHDETSYILYKHEYPTIQVLIRYHDELDEPSKKEREAELKRTYHPTTLRRFKRKTVNFFKTMKDSVMEVVNLLIGQTKKVSPAGAILVSKDRHTSQIKQELVSSVGTSFEPLLERHIGKMVVLEVIKGGKIFEYPGVLKDYTAEFIEVMDVYYSVKEDQEARKADLVIPRRYGVVRHLGE